jgi:hypothetical protein
MIWNVGLSKIKRLHGQEATYLLVIQYEYFLMVFVLQKTESNIKGRGGRKWLGSNVGDGSEMCAGIRYTWLGYTELPAEPTHIIPKMGGLNRRNCDNLNTLMHIIQWFLNPKIINTLSVLNCSALVLWISQKMLCSAFFFFFWKKSEGTCTTNPL